MEPRRLDLRLETSVRGIDEGHHLRGDRGHRPRDRHDLLFRDHEVIAYLPALEQVPDQWGNGIEAVVGDFTDAAAIDAAVAGGEAVINALDPHLGRPGRPPVRGTDYIVASMHRHGIGRYIGAAPP